MTAPAGGFFLRLPGLPSGRVVRAVRVDVAESGPEAFSAVIAANASAQRLTFDGAVWNAQVTELAAIATTIAAPGSNIDRSTGEIRYSLRVPEIPPQGGTGTAREVASGTDGRPVLGAPLLVLRGLGLGGITEVDPTASGINADEALRRTWVLALYEELALMGRRAQVAPAASGRAAGVVPWAVVGGVVLVAAAVSAVVYGVQRAEVERQQAVELEVLRNGARAQEERLRVRERTGTMPPVTQAEQDAHEVLQRRANSGLERAANAINEAIRAAGDTAGKGLMLLLLAGGGYLILSGDK